MSRSGFSDSPIAGDTTRQKLDELEALIQQMLNLPVNRLDPDWPVAPAAPAAEVGDRGQRTEDRKQETGSREQATKDRGQKTEDGGQRGKEDRGQEVGEMEEDKQVQPVVPSSVLCPLSSDLRPSPPRWWLYPVLGLNLLFDGLTFLLGPVGRWLRSETGRLVMGWAGVGLLLAALLWTFLGWMGWID